MSTDHLNAGQLPPLTPAVFYILLALADGDKHGYGIMKEVEERTEGQIRLKPGTLYQAISRLVSAGLIEEIAERPDPATDDERRRYYRLTGGGARPSSLKRNGWPAPCRWRARSGCCGRAWRVSRRAGAEMRTAPRTRSLSDRIYRASLVVYPRRHRAHYGSEMALLFSDLCQEVYRQEGTVGVARLWLATMSDLLVSALEMRIKELAYMTREQWTRLAGWALMFGALTFAVGGYLGSLETEYWDDFGGFDALYEYGAAAGFILTPLLFSIGLFGMRSRYGAAAGPAGSMGLLGGAVAGLVAVIAGVLVRIVEGESWYVWVAGFLLMFAGLLLFGIAAARTARLGRLAALSIVAGGTMVAWIPAGSGLVPDSRGLVTLVVFLIVAGAMFLLGLVLQGDATRRTAVPA